MRCGIFRETSPKKVSGSSRSYCILIQIRTFLCCFFTVRWYICINIVSLRVYNYRRDKILSINDELFSRIDFNVLFWDRKYFSGWKFSDRFISFHATLGLQNKNWTSFCWYFSLCWRTEECPNLGKKSYRTLALCTFSSALCCTRRTLFTANTQLQRMQLE